MEESINNAPQSTRPTREELMARLPIPGPGRKPDTPENKELKKARKQLIEEYKDALAEALPMINPVLVAKAISGDVPAIKEVHDRVMDKAKQPTDIKLEGEIVHQITGMRIQIDGDRLQNKEPETTPSN